MNDLGLWEDECSDVPTWDELGAESLTAADATWRALPVETPERSLLVILRFGRRLRSWLHIK